MSSALLSPLLVLVLFLNFFVLCVSRLSAVIWGVALQGLLLGALLLVAHEGFTARLALVAFATIVIKGLVIPKMLFYALREVQIRREIEPLLGFIPSLLLGAVGTGLAIAFANTLPLVADVVGQEHVERAIIATSLSTVFTGSLLLTTRRKAIMQVLGYIVLENGIFVFGLLLLKAALELVEFGVLLDLFVGVFVMGIILYHINREFSSVSTDNLSALKE